MSKPVVSKPSVKDGEPCVAGTRVPITVVMGKMARGMSFEDILKHHPTITREKLEAALVWVGKTAASAARHEISDQDIQDVVTTAFEGGINYWCLRANGTADATFLEANPSPDAAIRLTLHNPEDVRPGPNGHCLTAENLRRAIVKEAVRRFLENYDAADADVVVQQAVFGEVVYA